MVDVQNVFISYSYLVGSCSLNWQHQLCKNPRSNPDIKTLFTDHTCNASNGTRAPPLTNTPLAGPIPKPGVFPPLGGHVSRIVAFDCKLWFWYILFSHILSLQPFQSVVSPPPSAIAGWMSPANPSIPHAAVAAAPPGLVQAPNSGKLFKRSVSAIPNQFHWLHIYVKFINLFFHLLLPVAFLKHPRTPPGGPGMDYQTADSEHLMKRLRAGQPDEVSNYRHA